jgi:hypothetical protein
MFLDSFGSYLDITNGNRIAGLSVHDPFAIAGFIMLVVSIPIALILLTITARRSAYSIYDRVDLEARYLRIQLLNRQALLRQPAAGRHSQTSSRAIRGKFVAFSPTSSSETLTRPGSPGMAEAAPMLQTDLRPSPLKAFKAKAPVQSEFVSIPLDDATETITRPGSPSPAEAEPMLQRSSSRRASKAAARPSTATSADYDFEVVYDRWVETRRPRPPQIPTYHPKSDEEHRKWTENFQELLRKTLPPERQ